MDTTAPEDSKPVNTATASELNHENENRGKHIHHPVKNESNSNRGRKPQKRQSENGDDKMNKKATRNRKWDGKTRRDKNIDTRPPEVVEDGEKEERRPKKKVACFIGYSGEGYHGMQLYPFIDGRC
jgi:hypothetical protein